MIDTCKKAHTLRSAFKEWLKLHNEGHRAKGHIHIPSWFSQYVRTNKMWTYIISNGTLSTQCNRKELDCDARREFQGHYSFEISDKELFDLKPKNHCVRISFVNCTMLEALTEINIMLHKIKLTPIREKDCIKSIPLDCEAGWFQDYEFVFETHVWGIEETVNSQLSQTNLSFEIIVEKGENRYE